MYRRKIQLIAGSTYSVSLPKQWVVKNHLKEKQEVMLQEKNDRTLTISPRSVETKKPNDISLNVDEYTHTVDRLLFTLYYLGIENITLFSKKLLTKETKSEIRKALTYMSGTEISYEDTHKITIKVLLDKSKVNIINVLYRISLIIDSSLLNLAGQLDIEEIRVNEDEVDRLYQLISKIISLSLIDPNVLHTSHIQNISLIPSYFLISKKLENIADNIDYLSEHLLKTNGVFQHKEKIIPFLRKHVNRAATYLLTPSRSYEKIAPKELTVVKKHLSHIGDKVILNYIDDIVRYLIDIEEEIVNISIYYKLIQNNVL